MNKTPTTLIIMDGFGLRHETEGNAVAAAATPRLEQFFHYRNLDVSSFKECVKRWAPEVMKKYQKTSRHEALSDIYDSVEELRFYRQEIMKI